MKYIVQILVYFVLQQLPFIGSVTIDFNSIGYIGESIVLQCQDTSPIFVRSADWYRGGSFMDITSSRYRETTNPTGFNLTISSLVTTDGGVYHCGIGFDISTTKSLTIYYNTKDVNITQLYPKGIEVTFIAFPDPVYAATVKQDGVQLDVNWTVFKSTQASGAIKVSLQNSTAFTNQNKIYTVRVKITSPVSLDVEQNITLFSDLTTQSISDLTTQRSKSCALKLGLGLGLGLGIPFFVGCIIVIVILVKKGFKKPPENLAVDIDIGDTLGQHGSDVNIICSVYGSENKSVDWTGQEENILTNDERYTIAPYDSNTNKSCLTISTSSMTNAEGYICQVEFKKSGGSVKIYITVSDNGSLTYSIEKIILFVPASENESRKWIGPQKNILTDTGKYTIVPYDSKINKSHLTVKDFFGNDNGSYTCQPKNSSGTSPTYSIKITTNGLKPPPAPGFKKPPKNRKLKSGHQPLLHETVKTDGIPKHRPQPTSPENSDVEDRNLRGIHVSANFDDSKGLPTDIPRSIRLPHLPQKQPAVEEEDASVNSKQKKNKKKKGKVNEGNPEEMAELNRKLPEDQSDEE